MKQLYSMRDEKIGAYISVFEARGDGDATRMLSGAIEEGNTTLGKYPQDFSLWRIGMMAEESGKLIQQSDEPRHVINAIALAPAIPKDKPLTKGKRDGGAEDQMTEADVDMINKMRKEGKIK